MTSLDLEGVKEIAIGTWIIYAMCKVVNATIEWCTYADYPDNYNFVMGFPIVCGSIIYGTVIMIGVYLVARGIRTEMQ